MSGVRDLDEELVAEVLAAANALKRGRRQPGMLPCVTITGESWERLQDAIAACAYGTHPATASIRLASLEVEGDGAAVAAAIEGLAPLLGGGRLPYAPPKLTELSPDDARAVALRKEIGAP